MISLTVWLFRISDMGNFFKPLITDQISSTKIIDSFPFYDFRLSTTIYGKNEWGEKKDIKIFNDEAMKNRSMLKELIRYHLYEKGLCEYYENYFHSLDYNEMMVRAYHVIVNINHLTFFVKEYTEKILKFIQYLKIFCSNRVYVFEGDNEDNRLSEIHNPYEFMGNLPDDNFGTISFSFIKSENIVKLENELEGFSFGINDEYCDINIKTDGSDRDLRNKSHILINTLRDLQYPIPNEKRFSKQELLATTVFND